MRRTLIGIAWAIVFGLAVSRAAQAHPDFSGRWELVTDAGRAEAPVRPPFGTTFTITQTDVTLTITHVIAGRSNTPGGPAMTPVVTTYTFDGAMNNVTMVVAGSQRSMTYTTSAWEDGRLVSSSFWTPAPEPIKPSAKTVLWLNAAGELVIEHEQNGTTATTRYRKKSYIPDRSGLGQS